MILVLLLLAGNLASAEPSDAKLEALPNARAEKIALAQSRVVKHFAELKRSARRIGNRKLREATVSMLEKPRFEVLAARRPHEKEIAKQLRAEGLLNGNGPLFPSNAPMAFVAAPGGPWKGHHAYPGGLVYHTLFNLRSGIALARNYQWVYGIAVDEDAVRAAAVWHDSAKTFTLPWKEDGSLPEEETALGGTSAHHIWAIAEALYRKLPPRFVVILASAHDAAWPAEARKRLCGYLRAGARIAGVEFAAAGLRPDGQDLAGEWAKRPPTESFIAHFDDGDYPLTITSQQAVAAALDTTPPDYWKRAERLAAQGDVALYHGKR